MKNWHNTDELDELLGRELDLDQAWSEFKKDKKKTRRIPIWWCFGIGSILLLGMVWYFGNLITLKMDGKETAAIVLHPSAVPSFEKEMLAPKPERGISQKQLPSTNKNIPSTGSSKANKKIDPPSINYSPSREPTYPVISRHLINSKSSLQKLSSNRKLLDKHTLSHNDIEISNEGSAQIEKIEKLSSLLALPLPISQRHLKPFSIPNENLSSFTFKKWSVGMQYALAKAHRNLSGGQEEYTQRRQEEQFLELNRLELVVIRNLSNYFFLQTGFALTQYRSKLVEDIQTITSPVLYENVITETQTKDNLTQEIIGTAEGSQLEINRFTRLQRYQTLSVPLRVGWQIPLFAHWQLMASTGVSYSIYGQTKGLTFSSALPDGVYVPLSQLGYRKIGVLEGMGQMSIARSFGNTSLQIGLHGTIDLNNRLKKSTSGRDKFRSYGIQIGYRRSF